MNEWVWMIQCTTPDPALGGQARLLGGRAGGLVGLSSWGPAGLTIAVVEVEPAPKSLPIPGHRPGCAINPVTFPPFLPGGLQWALELQGQMDELFWDEAGGGYYNNTAGDESILLARTALCCAAMCCGVLRCHLWHFMLWLKWVHTY